MLILQLTWKWGNIQAFSEDSVQQAMASFPWVEHLTYSCPGCRTQCWRFHRSANGSQLINDIIWIFIGTSTSKTRLLSEHLRQSSPPSLNCPVHRFIFHYWFSLLCILKPSRSLDLLKKKSVSLRRRVLQKNAWKISRDNKIALPQLLAGQSNWTFWLDFEERTKLWTFTRRGLYSKASECECCSCRHPQGGVMFHLGMGNCNLNQSNKQNHLR